MALPWSGMLLFKSKANLVFESSTTSTFCGAIDTNRCPTQSGKVMVSPGAKARGPSGILTRKACTAFKTTDLVSPLLADPQIILLLSLAPKLNQKKIVCGFDCQDLHNLHLLMVGLSVV